jgi:hypothetical protein
VIEKHSGQVESKEVFYECIEAYARERIREWVQDLLEQEVAELLGRINREGIPAEKRSVSPPDIFQAIIQKL